VAVDKLGIKALLEPSIRKIAVANPEHALMVAQRWRR
jgi:hypothetical protein